MSRVIFIIVICTSCAATSNWKSFEFEQQNFPVFFIGNGFSWDCLIFEGSVVYRRGFSDMGGYLGEKYPTYNFNFLNDSTIHLKPIQKNLKRYIHPNEKTLVIDKSSELCQLLIPFDSIKSFTTELKEEFQREIVDYNFIPSKEAQELIDVDSMKFYPMLLKEDFSHYLGNFTTKFESLGIYNGKGF